MSGNKSSLVPAEILALSGIRGKDPARVLELESQPAPREALSGVHVAKVLLDAKCRIVVATDPQSLGADRIRYLGMRLRGLKSSIRPRSIVVTSPHPEDGKSTMALNLAATLAENGKRSVLLIEGDLHRPGVAGALGLDPVPGLAECLESNLDPIEALSVIDPLGFYLLQCGKASMNPTELLLSAAFPRTMARFTPHFDWIVVDTPPVAPLSDGLILSRQLDGTLLVVRADRTPKEAIEEAVTKIGPERILGIVVNAAEELNSLCSKFSPYYQRR